MLRGCAKNGKVAHSQKIDAIVIKFAEEKKWKFRASLSDFRKMILLLALLCGQAFGQTTYDWLNTAPDGNFRQGAAGARWNPGGLWDEPPYGIVQFNNNNQVTMTNNVPGTWSQHKFNFGTSATTARTIGGNPVQFFDNAGTWPFIRNQSSANHTINFNVLVGTGGTWGGLEFVNTGGNLTFGGTINNQGKNQYIYGNNTAVDGNNRATRWNGIVSGAGFVNVSQFGVLKLNAANTYTGQTQIDNGELWIESSGSVSPSSGIFIGNGGQLANVAKLWLSNPTGGTTMSNNITINNGNTTTRYLGGLNTSGTHTFSGNITNNSTTGGLYLSALNSGGTVAFTGIISGASNLLCDGAGVVILGGANTYTGTTTVNNGTLQMGVTNALPSTTAVNMANVAGTTLNLNNFNQSIASLAGGGFANGTVNLGSATLSISGTTTNTFNGTITGTGGLSKSGTGTLILAPLASTITYTGPTNISAGEIRLNPGSFSGLTMSTNITMSGGKLSTTGISATSATLGTLNMTASSTIALGANVNHSIRFAASNGVTWTLPSTLIITGWAGVYNGTSGSGTTGQIYVGTDNTGLTATQLSQILFFNGTNYYSATILSDGEVVPRANIAMFWGGTAAQSWTATTGTRWDITPIAPTYATNWTSGRGAIFNVPNSSVTGATTAFTYIIANENVTVTPSNTLNTGGTLAPIFVASGKTFNFQGQNLSTAAGTGFIKNGAGNLISASGTAGCLPAGVTLNSGLLAWGGVNGFGNGTLTINGGVLSADGSPRSPNTGSIVVNSNFQFGDAVNYAAGSGNLTFSSTVSLGASATRTITLGRASTYSLNGVISGTSSNLILAATAAGTLSLGAANTYGGSTTINGGTLSCGIAAALPSTTGVALANTAGAILDINGFNQSIVSLSGGGTTGGNISLGAGALTVNQSTNTTYAGVISGTGSLTKSGSGILTLSGVNSYTGLTKITAGTLQLGSADIISNSSNFELNGGIFRTGSGAGFSETVGTLNLSANSSIALGTGAHTLTFANSSAVVWTAATTLTITGWSGTAGTSGTAGKIFFGNTTGTLTAAQLAQISFTGYPGTPILLSTGELVPPVGVTSYTWNATTGSADWQTPASWTPARNTPSTTDVLNFTNGGSSVATNIPTETVAQFIVSNNTAITLQSAAAGTTLTLQGNVGSDLSVASGSTLVIGDGTNSIALNYSGTGHTASIAGTLTVSNSSTANNYNTTNAVTTISGTLNNGGSITAPAAQLLINGTYNHTHTTIGGTIPTATWNAASNCNIIGYTTATSASGGFSHTFGNFYRNSTSQTTTLKYIGP